MSISASRAGWRTDHRNWNKDTIIESQERSFDHQFDVPLESFDQELVALHALKEKRSKR